MSVRVALGAGRRQIAMQLVAESIALASVAGAAAVVCAWWATPALVSLVPASVNLAAAGDIRLDRTVLLFAAAITLMTTVAFSLFSGLGLRRDNTAGRLVSPGRVSTGAAVRRATSALVAAEIALAIVLLSGAGLVLRSFSSLLPSIPDSRAIGCSHCTSQCRWTVIARSAPATRCTSVCSSPSASCLASSRLGPPR
jgi:putative ABC transport system permease protein